MVILKIARFRNITVMWLIVGMVVGGGGVLTGGDFSRVRSLSYDIVIDMR